MTNDQPIQEIVRQGFDRVAENYLNTRDRSENQRYLDLLIDRLSPDATILDLGCGAGIPIDEYLITKGRKVIGLDISEKQIKLARKNVPQGHFALRDMSSLAPGEYQADAVVSFYAIFHTPREQHEQLLRTTCSFLPLHGWLLITMGSSEWEGVEYAFHGGTMAWSHVHGHLGCRGCGAAENAMMPPWTRETSGWCGCRIGFGSGSCISGSGASGGLPSLQA